MPQNWGFLNQLIGNFAAYWALVNLQGISAIALNATEGKWYEINAKVRATCQRALSFRYPIRLNWEADRNPF